MGQRDAGALLQVLARQLPDRAQAGRDGQGVKHKLAVRIGDTLRFTRGARRVEDRCARVFGKIGKGKTARLGGDQSFVFTLETRRKIDPGLVCQKDQTDRPHKARQQRQKDRQKILMAQDGIVFGMVEGIEHLFGRQADVDRVQRGPDHRNGKEAFQIAQAVPIHHRNGRACSKAQSVQRRGQTPHTGLQVPIGQASAGTIMQRLQGVVSRRCLQKLANGQGRIVVYHVSTPFVRTETSRQMTNLHMTKNGAQLRCRLAMCRNRIRSGRVRALQLGTVQRISHVPPDAPFALAAGL